ncbi:MAG: GNAT family N-acetyltransferase [Rhizonema sp. NSF051]|nr:GNAT family N-acetyltransferase [Rhizonema sp. NSF051]
MNSQVISLSDSLWSQSLHELRHDIYHLPEYLHIEAKRTNTIAEAIVISEEKKIFFLPYLLRSCNNLLEGIAAQEVFDVVSPNGYAGILLNNAAAITPDFLNSAIQQLKSLLQSRNVCSAFIRLHPILNQGFNEFISSEFCQVSGETISIDLTLSQTEMWHQTRQDHRSHINKCKRAGFIAKIVALEDYIDEFVMIYNQTMNRVEAKQSFYFDYDYFSRLANLNEKIHLGIVELDGEITYASIFTENCQMIQYHLSGTKNEFLKQAPNKLMIDYVRLWAKERGNKVFHLGGGVGAGKDSLYNFKAGFSKQTHPCLTLRLIVDEEKYNSLVKLRAKSLETQPEALLQSNYFPAYRFLN